MMKKSWKLVMVAAVCCVTTIAGAQTATLTANTDELSPRGGSVTVALNAGYDGQPGALGWSLELPAKWSLAAMSGSALPQIAPATGSTGTLEFAYTVAPANRAAFMVMLKYPPNVVHASVRGLLLVRQSGRLTTVSAEPLSFARPQMPATAPR